MPDRRDVFLSYSSVDRIYAEKLATDLLSWGVSVWWDQWEIKVGDSLIEKIQEGISTTSWLAIVLTPDSVSSPWVQKELSSVLISEVEDAKVIVLPLLFRDCTLPPFLRDKKYADFRRDYDQGLRDLLDRLSPPVTPDVIAKLLSEDRLKILSAYEGLSPDESEAYTNNLLQRLSGGSVTERGAAIYALWALDHDLLPVAFLKGLRDPSNTVRHRTIFLIGETRDGVYARTIAGLLSDGNASIRQVAREAHEKIRGTGPGPG